MSTEAAKNSAKETLELVEDSREKEWVHPSFAGELFMGRFRPDLVFPYPHQPSQEERHQEAELLARLRRFLREEVDAEKIDREGEMPPEVIEGLKREGFFGMKIPKEYGGMGVSQSTYGRAMELVASHCASTAVWLSAHQSIGVPQPLKIFGTKEQKEKYLPQMVKDKLSGFGLTEPTVGSDPADMKTFAEPTEDGKHYILNGEKLWCTNGTVADILIVMARTPSKTVHGKERKQISAFIVETDGPGIEIVHRCQFLGLRGIANGLLRFHDVKVPKENLLLGEGRGLKLALVTLNTGRLTLPAACTGAAKVALRISREWAKSRRQWGVEIGKHEAIAEKLSCAASDTFAMEAMTWLTSGLVDKGGFDIRIEAAMAKLHASEATMKSVDDTLQIRGGRGYENENSMRERGEPTPEPVERLFRDARINTIVEGSSEIMHLFLAREALDEHMRLAGALLDPRTSFFKKFTTTFKAGLFYVRWYPGQWLSWRPWRRHSEHGGQLAHHLRWVDRSSHRLARTIFHSMMRHQARLERRQLLLSRIVDIGVELFAITACVSKAQAMLHQDSSDRSPFELADTYCRRARTKVKELFRAVRSNDDNALNQLSKSVLEGRHEWLEAGLVGQGEEAPKSPQVTAARPLQGA